MTLGHGWAVRLGATEASWRRMVVTRSGGDSGGGSSSRSSIQGVGSHSVPLKRSVVKKRKIEARSPATQSTPKVAKLVASAKKAREAKTAHVKAKKNAPSKTGVVAPPSGWDEHYRIVQELRTIRDAPVDEFGSEALPEREASPAVFRYQVLIALMLSSQTRDQIVGSAMRKLQAHGLTVENILRTDDEVLRSMLFGVGFYNNKTKYIKQTSQILMEKYGGDVPRTAKELCALPGIGPKMAYIILNVAHGVVTGIGIDTHMHRIMNQLRWMQTKTPEQTRAALESWLPREEWGKINLLFVGFGQQVRLPIHGCSQGLTAPVRAHMLNTWADVVAANLPAPQIQTEPTKLLIRACDCIDPPATFQLLRKVGIDINSRDTKEKKRTALHQVAAGTAATTPQQQLQYLRQLLAAGVKPALRDEGGLTAAELAGPDVWGQL